MWKFFNLSRKTSESFQLFFQMTFDIFEDSWNKSIVSEWAPPFGDDAFIPTVFENIEGHLEKKLEAFRCFSTQIKEFPHPRSLKTIEIQSNLRGATVGMNNAESFMLIREII